MCLAMVSAPQQQRSQLTLQKILLASQELLREKPIEQISMQDIAKSAGISVGNLYNRFADKDELVNQVVSDIQRQIDASISRKLAGQPEDMPLQERLRFLARTLQTHIKDLRPVFSSIATRQVTNKESLDEKTKSNTNEMIEVFTHWLMKSEDEIQGADKHNQCRFAAANIAFGIQFNMIFGTAERLFGKSYFRQLADAAYASLILEDQ